LSLLRSATEREHASVESHLPLMAPDLSRATYAQVLACFYPLIAAWEAWSEAHAPLPLRALVADRRRAPLLERDLRTLGAELPAVHDFPAARIPHIDSEEAAFLGAMYVIEGSTLGGQHIARHVEPLLGFAADAGTAYFRGYGAETGARWREFQTTLRDVPEEKSPVLIEAAKNMFDIFEAAILPVSPLRETMKAAR